MVRFIPSYITVCAATVNEIFSFSENLLLVYMRASVFFVNIDFVSCTSTMFIRSKNFHTDSTGSFKYRIMPSANQNNLTPSFSIFILFLSFFPLIAFILQKLFCKSISSKIRNKMGNAISLFLSSIMLA